jgi:hypothetical protein
MASDPRTDGNPRVDPRVRISVLTAKPSCAEVLALIDCYADCECDVTTMIVIAGHLDVCRECCEQLWQIRWIKSAVRRCGGAPESRPWH